MTTQEAEVLDAPPQNALVRKDNPTVAVTHDGTELKAAAATPQQMRVMEVSQALEPAYARASTLELTDAEIDALMAPFPDDIVDIRPHDGLIYISHIHISNRLNRIFKPGKWALICRRHWLEGSTMYGEYVLLIRGCFVGESIGGHPYVASNPKTNYSDALEATAGEALRRICGKRLSCGSQVWEGSYSKQWVAKHAHKNGSHWSKNTAAAPAAKKEPPPPPPADPGPEPEAEAAMGQALNKYSQNQLTAIGKLEKLDRKPTKNGSTRYGVMLDGDRWFNHFDSKLQENAEVLLGQKVYVTYIEKPYGQGKISKDLVSIEPDDDLPM